MKNLKKKLLALGSLGLLALTALPTLAASPSIVFSLNGKAVTSVPVDKLTDLSVTVNTGGANFKTVFNGQWSGIDQAQTLKSTAYKRGTNAPSTENSSGWANYDLAVTSGDSNWGGLKELKGTMSKGAIELSLFKATTEQDIAFTSRFYRKVYTGKTVWQNNGWVQETRWEAVGPALGSATLKLEPPTFAASLDPKALFAPAIEKFNNEPDYYSQKPRAESISRTLLYPTSYGGRKVEFGSSKVLEFTLAEGTKPVYNWNYNEKDKSSYVQAAFTVNMKIHAVMSTTFESLPIPMKTEADFLCPIEIEAKRQLSESKWVTGDLSYNDDIRKTCKTADGKSADDIIKGVTPGGGGGAGDLLKGFGF
jgi:hypothetical protein